MGRKILASGHTVAQVLARNEVKGPALAKLLHADFTADHGSIKKDAFIYIVAITDNALPELHNVLSLDRSLVVHTAGSVSMSVLEKVSKNFGVLYPLQTFREETIDVPDFPLLVDGNTPETCTMIMDFAASISSNVIHADDDYRRKMHLAAVATGNFSNHLFALVEGYCHKEAVDFKLLLPMLREIVRKLERQHPFDMQTGPALRNDVETLNTHRQMLVKYPELSVIYDLISASIYNYHKPGKAQNI
jgi:hypothetical protein